ncbi:MAG: HEAT repeat domain-containing protein [Verrucomicrobiae bacterium]|nr:HEAT repeat domain-containing protein [Verrucomicrobiae bacterium]
MKLIIPCLLFIFVSVDVCFSEGDQLQSDAPLVELIAGLESGDFSTRMRAVDFIGNRKEGAKEAVPALVDALGDYHMRESALHALKAIGPAASDAIPALYEALTAYPEQPATRWIAAHALANVGRAAVPILTRGLSSSNPYERVWCNAALARMEGAASSHFVALAAFLSSSDKKTVKTTVEALTMIGEPSQVILTEILATLERPEAPSTDLAVLLAQFGHDAAPAVPQLVRLLDHSNAMTRQRAAYALSEIGGDDVIPAIPGLVRNLSAEQSYVREQAAVALGSIGKPAQAAISELIGRLSDADEQARAAAVVALGKIDVSDSKVISALVGAMGDESGRVRSAAAPIVAEYAPVDDDLISIFVQASEDPWKNVQHACETFFSRLGPAQRRLIPERFLDSSNRW